MAAHLRLVVSSERAALPPRAVSPLAAACASAQLMISAGLMYWSATFYLWQTVLAPSLPAEDPDEG